jgi:hypothetical protein
VAVIRREGSVPVDEDAVAAALQILRVMPGGIAHLSMAVLTLLGRTMAPHDFAALKFDLADGWRSAGDSPPQAT